MERMTGREYEETRAQMRARYAAPAEVPGPRPGSGDRASQPTQPLLPASDPTPPGEPDKPAATAGNRTVRARRPKRKDPDASERTEPIGDWEP